MVVAKVVDGVNGIGASVDPVKPLIVVVESETVGPAAFRHVFAHVEDDAPSGAR